MPAPIQAEQLDGLIKTTQPHIVRERKASIAERLTKYIGVQNVMKNEKVMVSDGQSIQWNLTTDHSHTAMQVGLYDTLAPATALHAAQFNIPWKHTRAHVSWDLREVSMNKSRARILNYVKEKLFEMDVAWFEHLESQIWTGPTTGDESSVLGIWGGNGWLFSPDDAGETISGTDWATSGDGARVNVNPPGGAVGGVSRVTHSRLAPWYQAYTTANYDDLFSKMRHGFDEIDYESPVNAQILMDGNRRFGIYCTEEDARTAADQVRLQNENIGSDLAYYDGRAMIRGTPITGVPKINELDAARTTPVHPFVVLDWSQLRPVVLEDWGPFETTAKGGQQPVVVSRVRYMVWNLRCWNAKTLALFTTS